MIYHIIILVSVTKEETIDTPETTQTGPTIKIDILNAVAPSIDGQWKALAEKMGLKDTVRFPINIECGTEVTYFKSV